MNSTWYFSDERLIERLIWKQEFIDFTWNQSVQTQRSQETNNPKTLYLTVKEACRQNAGTNKSLYIICGPKVDGITK